MRISTIAFAGIFALLLGTNGWTQNSTILDDNDADAKRALIAMKMAGDLQQKRWAEAWVVLSSVALGMGIDKCDFSED